jgi:MFS superfamily sulfate permease-like transporter
VVIPKAMAYATIAGLPVQVGLDTAFVPMIICGAWDISASQREYNHNDCDSHGK